MLLLELPTDVWVTLFEYLTSSERVALERTCSTLYALSLDCPVPWRITIHDEWYWSSPLPNEYTIHRRGLGEVKIRRHVIATYQQQYDRNVYWKGEDFLTFDLQHFDHCSQRIQQIAAPREWVLVGNCYEDGKAKLPQNHLLWTLVGYVDPTLRWESFCKQLLCAFYPHIVGPWGSYFRFTARWVKGQLVDASIDDIHWNNEYRTIWEHREEWLSANTSYEIDFADSDNHPPLVSMKGMIGKPVSSIHLFEATSAMVEKRFREETTELTCLGICEIDHVFPQVKRLRLDDVSPLQIEGNTLSACFPQLQTVDIYATTGRVDLPPQLQRLRTNRLDIFHIPVYVHQLTCLYSAEPDTLHTTLETDKMYIEGNIKLTITGSLVVSTLHLSEGVTSLPDQLTSQICHLHITPTQKIVYPQFTWWRHGDGLPPLFEPSRWRKQWDRLATITIHGKLKTESMERLKMWVKDVVKRNVVISYNR